MVLKSGEYLSLRGKIMGRRGPSGDTGNVLFDALNDVCRSVSNLYKSAL